MSETKTVFIIDDDPEIVRLVEACLSEYAFHLLTATDSEKAAKLAVEEVAPDLLIVDIRMPKLDGFQVIEKVRAKKRGVKIVILTGYYKENEAEIKKVKPDAVLMKPVGYHDLVETITQVLGGDLLTPRDESDIWKPLPEGVHIKLGIVEDETDFQEYLEEYFGRLGYEVHAYERAADYLKEEANHSCPILITDEGLPGMKGHELIRQLKENGKMPPCVIVTSGNIDPEIRKVYQELGVKEFIDKPLKLEEISRTVLFWAERLGFLKKEAGDR